MKVLIVYELVPEETHVYIVDVEDVDTLETIKRCHSKYLNAHADVEDQESLEWLSEWLREDSQVEIADDQPIPISDCELLIHTGFLL
jgi:hypothetical protein